MAQQYHTRLTAAGCMIEQTTLCNRLVELLGSLHGDWSDEELMRHPIQALEFCNVVRGWEGCGELPDDLILGLLSYPRKNPSSFE